MQTCARRKGERERERKKTKNKSSQAAKIRIHSSWSLPFTPQRFLSVETIGYKSVSVSAALHVECPEITLFCRCAAAIWIKPTWTELHRRKVNKLKQNAIYFSYDWQVDIWRVCIAVAEIQSHTQGGVVHQPNVVTGLWLHLWSALIRALKEHNDWEQYWAQWWDR